VTISSALAALSAGLDRDEQLARAAAEDHGDTWQARETWWLEGVEHHTVFNAARGELAHVAYAYEENAPHIARQDPKRTFRQVEAIRQALTIVRHQTLLFDSARDRADAERHAFEQGFQAAAGLFIEALAKGYTEDTTETEKP